jgi:DNA-binding FadR family transcriptional regulator
MSEYLGPIPMQTAGERIAERIVTAIALGEFVPDQRLPTERELAAASATHNGRLVALSASIRREVSLGFDAEPYTPRVRERAIHQHPTLAEAVIAGDQDRAAGLAAEHFSLTEEMLTELHARIRIRSGGSSDAGSQSQ